MNRVSPKTTPKRIKSNVLHGLQRQNDGTGSQVAPHLAQAGSGGEGPWFSSDTGPNRSQSVLSASTRVPISTLDEFRPWKESQARRRKLMTANVKSSRGQHLRVSLSFSQLPYHCEISLTRVPSEKKLSHLLREGSKLNGPFNRWTHRQLTNRIHEKGEKKKRDSPVPFASGHPVDER